MIANANTDPTAGDGRVDPRAVWLLFATFVVAIIGLIYEMLTATLSSYLLGDSVKQFSFVIGIFLSAMGFGAWASRFVSSALPAFIMVQIGLGIVGGISAPAIYAAYGYLGGTQVLVYGLLIVMGALSGMEIPLISRVLEEIGVAKFRFENVLSVDYLGALIASLAFPLLILPNLSLIATSLAFGLLNLCVAGISIWMFRKSLTGRSRRLVAPWAGGVIAMLIGLSMSGQIVSTVDAKIFQDEVVLQEQTPYQKITVTRFRDRVRLYLDHSIQFDSRDEYRYHEALVHPALAAAPQARDVLMIGGGDGMGVREVLRAAPDANITLVDLDPRMTELFRDNPELSALNGNALSSPRVTIRNVDAWTFAGGEADEAGDGGLYDVIILDLPDPKSVQISRLYSLEFYAMLMERLRRGGVVVTQAGSPLLAGDAFWSVAKTLDATRNPSMPDATLHTTPYQIFLPSFGSWGFVMATPWPLDAAGLQLDHEGRFINGDTWKAALTFSPDMGDRPVELNNLESHKLLHYYLEGWEMWFQ
jgi:spermidine synthase